MQQHKKHKVVSNTLILNAHVNNYKHSNKCAKSIKANGNHSQKTSNKSTPCYRNKGASILFLISSVNVV